MIRSNDIDSILEAIQHGRDIGSAGVRVRFVEYYGDHRVYVVCPDGPGRNPPDSARLAGVEVVIHLAAHRRGKPGYEEIWHVGFDEIRNVLFIAAHRINDVLCIPYLHRFTDIAACWATLPNGFVPHVNWPAPRLFDACVHSGAWLGWVPIPW